MGLYKWDFGNDIIIVGAVAGLVADGVMDILEAVLVKFKILKYSLDLMAAGMIIQHPVYLKSGLGHLVGYLAGAALSMIVGVVFVYLMKKMGPRWLIVKGMIYGWIVWFLIYGGVASGLKVTYLYDYNPVQALLQLAFHMIYGALIAGVVAKLGNWMGSGV